MHWDLRLSYWWPSMKKEIASFVERCLTCRKVKGKHERSHNKLQPFEIPMWKCEHITMDFITKLPRKTMWFDAIWMIVDHLTKSAHFLIIRKSSSAKKLADIYIWEIVDRHRVPVSILSDWYVWLTSMFWKRFPEELGLIPSFSWVFIQQQLSFNHRNNSLWAFLWEEMLDSSFLGRGWP